jgi:hypothetical protein
MPPLYFPELLIFVGCIIRPNFARYSFSDGGLVFNSFLSADRTYIKGLRRARPGRVFVYKPFTNLIERKSLSDSFDEDVSKC